MMTEMEQDYAGRIIEWAFNRPETRSLSMPDLIQAYWDEQLNPVEEISVSRTENKSWLRVEAVLTRYNLEIEEFMADIIHWCDEEDVNFDDLIMWGKGSYLEDLETLREVD